MCLGVRGGVVRSGQTKLVFDTEITCHALSTDNKHHAARCHTSPDPSFCNQKSPKTMVSECKAIFLPALWVYEVSELINVGD